MTNRSLFACLAVSLAALALAGYAALKPSAAVGDTNPVTYATQYVKDLATSAGSVPDKVTILAVREHGNTAIVKARITFHQQGAPGFKSTVTLSVTLLRGVWVERYTRLTS